MIARLALWATVLMIPAAAWSAPVAEHVPADAMVYIGWQGAADMGPGFAQSHLKAVLDESQFREFVNDFLPRVIDKVGQLNPQAGQIGQMIATIAKPSWQRPTAFFFSGIEQAPNKPPMPHLGVIWEAGPDAGALATQLDQLIAQSPAPFPVKVLHKGALVALLVGYDDPENALPSDAGKSLEADPAFMGAMKHLTITAPVAASYINCHAILKLVDGLVPQFAPPDAATMWPKVRDDLGLAGLGRIVAASGFDGKDFASQAFVESAEPRTGLLKLAAGGPLDDGILAAIPATATSAGAGRFDLGGLFDVILHTAGDVDPSAVGQVNDFLNNIAADSGVHLRNDLLVSLGDQWAYYGDPTIGGRGFASFVGVNHLKDPAKFEQSMAKIEDYAIQQIEKTAGAQVPVRVRFETTQVDGMTIHYLAVPLVAPCWAVQDGNLYVALYPQVAAAAARHVTAKDPSILHNDAFVAVRARLGNVNPSAFAFADLPKTAPDAYGVWLLISRLPGFGDLFGVKSPPLIMPELNKLMAQLAPAGSVGWIDAEGFHMRSIEPFPASIAIASNPTVSLMTSGYSSMLVSILLPALNRAREQANRVKSASNLRQIGQASAMYANDVGHKSQLPPDLATMIKDEDLTPEVFLNPRGDNAAAVPQDKSQWPQWVAQHSDYIWLGAGKNAATTTADTVLAYEKFDDLTDGINILYGDFHVEFVPMAEAREAIGKAHH